MKAPMREPTDSPRMRVAKNTAFIVSADVVSKFANLAFFVVLGRVLGDTGLGQYTFAISLGSLFAILAHYGFNNWTVREVAAHPEMEGRFLKNLLALKLLLAAGSLGALAAALRWMDLTPELRAVVMVVGFMLVVSNFNSFLMCFFRARERMEYEAALVITERFLKAGVGILVLWLGFGLLGMAAGVLVAGAATLAATGGILGRRFAAPGLAADTAFWRRSLREALPFFALAGFMTLYFRIDAVMLALIKGDEVVGWYGAAYKLLDVFIFIPVAFAGAVLPTITKVGESSRDDRAALATSLVRILLILGLPIAGAISVLADRVLVLIYGPGFEPGVLCLRVLIWTLPLRFLTPTLSSVLIAGRRQTSVLAVMVFGASLNVVLNLVLIPRYSLVGAAAATLTGEAAVLSLALWLSQGEVGRLRVGATLIRAGLATAALIVFLRAADAWSLLILVPAGLFLYPGILAGLRELRARDLSLVRAVLQYRSPDAPGGTPPPA